MKNVLSLIILGIILSLLSLVFLNFPPYRLPISIIIGISYFLWGVYTHWRDKTIHLSIVLEYFGISLLATILLIFISLRA